LNVEWKASAHAGLNVTSGNTRGLAVSGSGALSRRAGDHRFAAEISGSLARTQVEIAADTNGVPGIGRGEVHTVVETTMAAWAAKLRYDRFFGKHHSLYGAASAAADAAAGKRLIGALQLGYSRELLRRTGQSLTVEVGYDLAHQDYVSATQAVAVHSARLFTASELTTSPSATASIGAELLTNVGGEDTATGHVKPLEDDRITGRAELSLKVNDHGRLAMRLNARYDSRPAPRPAPAGSSWEDGYSPLADRIDTRSELVFAYSFL